ncbi:PREDICTED: cytochrome b5 [Nicrophorus vespilloides]|uniref:Cytochrome b5 n=1 Tax=Nicrophorus vespilloides TaxID=110193 RepID=A0ABM1MTJ3_NICVS|nr:PREDICTED: cytochrome b5 [Nicrophorus vespilloides]
MVDTPSIINAFLSVIKYKSQVKLSKVAPGERIITLEEVSWHDKHNDCWVVIYDRIYDITDFLNEHPGGSDILLEYAGRDASVAFRGSGHSAQAIKSLEEYLIGELPTAERIFRKQNGYRLSDIPN